MPTAEDQKRHIPNKKKSIEMELLVNSNSNSWEILLTIAIAIVPKMSIAIVISILLISSGKHGNSNREDIQNFDMRVSSSLVSMMYLVYSVSAASEESPSNSTNKNSCRSDVLVLYKLVFTTFWSRESFPRQYPEWRPQAHFSKLIGK